MAATNLNLLSATLTANQRAVLDFEAGVDESGVVQATSFVKYLNGATAPVSTFGNGATISVSFFSTSSGFAFSQTEMDNAWQALQLWSGLTNLKFVLASDPSKAEVDFVHTGDTYQKKVVPSGTAYGVLTKNTTATPGLDTTTSGDIIIDNATLRTDGSGKLGYGDIGSYLTEAGYGIDTLVHEVGHLVGLGHTGPYNGTVDPSTQQFNEYDVRTWSIMSYVDPVTDRQDAAGHPEVPAYLSQYPVTADFGVSDSTVRAPFTPMGLDIIAAQRLDGAPTSTMFAGHNVFGFNSNIKYTAIDGTQKLLSMYDFAQDTVPVVTLYDYGADNTLDTSLFTNDETINLNDGTFSSIAGLTSNLFIEYSTDIDNFVGGSGNDTIRVNVRNDVIDGGAGINTAVLTGFRSDYVLSFNGQYTLLTAKAGLHSTYKFSNIQEFTFAGDASTVALSDISRVQWIGPAAGGHFGVAANWSDGTVPNAASDVNIVAANVTVTQQEQNVVDSLVIQAGSSIDIASGHFIVGNGTAGTQNHGIVRVEAGTTLYLGSSFVNSSSVYLYGRSGSAAVVEVQGGALSLSGGGTVHLSGSTADTIIGGPAPSPDLAALDNVDNLIEGTGTIGSSGFEYPLAFTNGQTGQVLATGPGSLVVNATTVNNGLLGAGAGATLGLKGSVDQSGGGSIFASGATAGIDLDGVTILGGTVIAQAGATIEVSLNTTLGNVGLAGPVKVDAGATLTLLGYIIGAADGSTVIDATAGAINLGLAQLYNVTLKLPSGTVTNGLTLNAGGGTIGLSGVTGGDGLTLGGGIANSGTIAIVGNSGTGLVGTLTIQGTTKLTGGGSIAMSDLYNAYPGTQIINGAASAVLDNEDNVITGYGLVGDGNLGLVNGTAAVIRATSSTMFVSPGTLGLANHGLVEAATSATLQLTGTVDNSNGRISASGGTLNLVDASVTGGVLTGFNGGNFNIVDVVALANLENAANLVASGNIRLTLAGAIVNEGSVNLLGNSGNGWYSEIIASGAVKLSGGGRVTLADAYNGNSYSQVVTGTSAATFENVDNAIIGYGNVGGGAVGFLNDAAGVVTGFNGQLTLDSGAAGIFNAGILQASGGTLNVVSSVSNTGQIIANNGGTVILHQIVGYSGTVAARNNGLLILDGGSLLGSGGVSISALGRLQIASAGLIDGTQQAVTLAGRTIVEPTATLTLKGHITNTGVISMLGNSGNGWYSTVYAQGLVTLDGGGQVTLADQYNANSASQQIGGQPTDTLDNVDNTISGYGILGQGKLAIVNEKPGVISGQNGLLTIDTGPNSLSNAGLLTAVGGALTVTTAIVNTGLIQTGNAGFITLKAGITGTGTISARSSGVILLDGARIGAGQSVSSTAGAIIEIGRGGASLDGSQHTLQLLGQTTVDPTGTLTLTGAVSNQGSILVRANSGNGWYGTVVIAGKVTLLGHGTVVLSDDYNSSATTQVVTGTTADTLDNKDNLIGGYGRLGDGLLALVNETAGIIRATSGTLVVASGAGGTTNTGLIEAKGGTLELHGAVANAGGTLSATGSALNLSGATVTGGTLTGSGGAVIDIADNVGLVSLSNAGTLVVDGNKTLSLTGTIGNTGSIRLQGNSGNGWYATLSINGAVTLNGHGTVTLSDAYDGNAATQVVGSTAAGSLVNADNLISGYGQVGAGVLGLVNQAAGTIKATGGTLTLNAGANTIGNEGLMEALGGTLELRTLVANTGTIEATSGSTVVLDAVVKGAGVIKADTGGTIALNGGLVSGGTFTVASGATLDVTSGGLLDGAATAVTLNGTTTVDGTATLLVDGTIANTGLIAVNAVSSNGWYATLQAIGTARLTGGGRLVLSDNLGNASTAIIAGAVLDNVDNAISGSGIVAAAYTGEAASSVTALGAMTFSGGVTNAGIIKADGAIGFTGGTVSNTGHLVADTQGIVYGAGAGNANLVAGTLTGGTWSALRGGDIDMTGGPITSLAATVELGSGTLRGGDGISFTAIEQSLASIVQGGVLQLDTGRSWSGSALSNGGEIRLGGGTFAASGIVNSGLIDGTGAITAAITGAGGIEAAGGTLTLTKQVSGALRVDAGSTMVVKGGAAVGTTLSFGGPGATLQIVPGAGSQPFNGRVTGSTAGDTIDLVGIAATGTSTGSTLGLTAGGTTLGSVTFDAGYVGSVASDGHGGTLVTAAPYSPDPLFDVVYYLAHNPDVAAAGVDPYQHFITNGWREGRNPSALFNTNYYLNQNPDVKAAGIDPLAHFEANGWKEGRDPSAAFSVSGYLAAYPDVKAAGVDPLVHYVQAGKAEGRLALAATPHATGPADPLLDAAYVYAHNPAVAPAGLDAAAWYHGVGWTQGADPNALFSTTYYLNQNPDVKAAGIDPLAHFEANGWVEGRDPSVGFSVATYLTAYPDVKGAGFDPLVHYLRSGQAEGRLAFAAMPHATGPADPMVDAAYVYAHNPAVAAAGLDAAAWYNGVGWTQGANPDALFDTSYYLTQNPDVRAAGIDPLAHFEASGWREGRQPSLVFDDAKYLAVNTDVAAAGFNPVAFQLGQGAAQGRMAFLTGGTQAADPLVDATYYDKQLGATIIPGGAAGAQQAAYGYDHGGWQKGLNPDALFDTEYYLSHNPDVAAAHIDPLAHYEANGWTEGRDPSAAFSTAKYLAAYGDVKAAGVDPLVHYLQNGQYEGRLAFAA